MIEDYKIIDIESYDYQLKLVLLGNSGVGKTKIISNYLNGGIPSKVEPTNSWTSKYKIIKNDEGKTILLELLDGSGKKENESTIPDICKNCDGGFVVYNICESESFQNIDRWVDELKKVDNDIPIALLGNQTDLNYKRKISEREGKKKAKELKISFEEVSANNGQNIDKVFMEIIKKMNKKYNKSNTCACC